MIINCANGKKYIGRDLNNNPAYLGGGVFINQALKKYGRKNFIKITLRRCDSKEDMIKWEKYYLDLYAVGRNKNCYNYLNQSNGGTRLGKIVYCYDMNGMYLNSFDSVREASRQVDINNSGIQSVLFGKQKSAKGYFWSHDKYKKLPVEILDSLSVENRGRNGCKIIYQYDSTGKYLQFYNSLKEASEHTGIGFKAISSACIKKHKSGDSFWSYLKYNSFHLKSIEKQRNRTKPCF